MKKIYFLAIIMASAAAMPSLADETVKFSADMTEKDGLTFYGRDYGPGDDRVMPIDWVEYEGFRMSFKVYPNDWTDPEGIMLMPPRSSVYFIPGGGAKAPQWCVYADNEFTVSAPEGKTLKSIEFHLISDNFKYGEVFSNVGSMECNGGDKDVASADRVPAKPYIWSSGNEEGYSSVTIKIGENQFDGKSSQQFFFDSVEIVAGGNQSAVGMDTADSVVTVYGIDGMKLIENAPKDAVSSLKEGVYVINGRKTIIRK
ncbi:MAG: hypothetical protein K2H49_00335 [Muribaculaceae bacterium]|nr:hypothetical protein [Muribaculaceae bacterium]